MGKTKTDTTYVAKASLGNVRISPQKARLVVDMVRGRTIGEALGALEFSPKKAAPMVYKLLLSAAANAKNRAGVDVDELYIKQAWVNEGKSLKRFMPRAQGRATPIIKRSSTISVVLDEIGA
jgi:large subunit ribosomal protein L22